LLKLNGTAALPRIAMLSLHGYVAANPPLGAADTGGQIVYVLELSKKLADMGYAVDIYTRQFLDQPAVEVVAPGVQILRLPCGGREFLGKEYLVRHVPEWVAAARELIRENGLRYQLLISHYWDAGAAGTSLRRWLDAPHIHVPHSLGSWKLRQMSQDYPDDAEALERKYNFAQRIETERRIYAEADFVLGTTPQQAQILSQDYPSSGSIRMIPAGYEDTRFYPVSEATRAGLRRARGYGDEPVIASVGRIARNKGYDLLIRAFQLVVERVPGATLQLAVGGERLKGPERDLLTELLTLRDELGLQESVKFPGYIPEDDLPNFYRAADVFVLSSRYEPFGMTAVEAMACGVPTVLTIHGGLWPLTTFGRQALFADPFDREDLGITITKILQFPVMRHRLSRMGACSVRSLFTWSSVAQQLLGLVDGRSQPAAATVGSWGEPYGPDE